MFWISRIMVALILIAGITGCASGPKYAEVSSRINEVPADSGRIYIYRTTALGAAVQPQVKLNGEAIGKAVPKGFFYVDKRPGEYTITTSTEVDRHLSLVLEKGQTRYVRLDVSIGFFVGHVYPKLVENVVGEKEIQETSYIGTQ